jgi:predicted TIM-barrel fold metal-dependent hydrolase
VNQQHPRRSLSRRTFLKRSATAAAVAALGPATGFRPARGGDGPHRAAPVIDCHAHLHHHSRVSWETDDRRLIEVADRLGIDQLCCSILTPRRPATPEGFSDCNRWLAEAMQRHAGRVLGYCYVNPGHPAQALDEIRRCIEERGFIGIKLYNEFRCTEPVVFPIVELAIALRVPILHHAGHLHYHLDEQPNISDGGDLAELARRYPEAMLICAHVCGGGDWEWTIKALRGAPSVYLDLSGSVTDDGVVEMAARVLGVERLLFGCDMSMTAGMGRIRAAELTGAEKARVLGTNMEAILRRRRA